MSELPAQRFLLEAVAVLERLQIPYIIIGGFAVRTWGVPRPTYDADVAVVVGEARLLALLGELELAGFDVPDEHRKGWLDSVAGMRKLKVTRFEGTTVWDVDLFLAQGAFLETAFARRRAAKFAGRDAWFLAPEDLILLKLVAYRRKDQLDVEEILKVSRDLDLRHLGSGRAGWVSPNDWRSFCGRGEGDLERSAVTSAPSRGTPPRVVRVGNLKTTAGPSVSLLREHPESLTSAPPVASPWFLRFVTQRSRHDPMDR